VRGPAERIGIIGGGVLGMTLAHRLRAAGMRPTIIEAASHTGGLADSHSIGDYRWDRFYHVILLSDTNLISLLGELGLTGRLRWGFTRTGFYTGSAFHSLSSSWDFVRFPLLSLSEKARLAATILHASRIKDWRPLEAESVEAWLTRWSGKRTYQHLWLPLLRSKLGENVERASAAFIWAIIARMYAARRSGHKQEMFGYVDGGYDTILQRFRQLLVEEGVDTICGSPVTKVSGFPGSASVHLADGSRMEFDRVVLTVPCPRIRAICPDLLPAEQARLDRVVYQGIVCPSLLLRRPLGGYYITNITDARVPFTAVIEMTALVDRERFGGNTLVYLPRYLTQDSETWSSSDEELVGTYIEALTRMYPDLKPSDVLGWQVGRAREVLALSTVNYSRDALPATRTSLPHVYVVNGAQIAAGTLNVNESVALANRKAAELLTLIRVPGRMTAPSV
jgi:protoporphyrinogen oxidase